MEGLVCSSTKSLVELKDNPNVLASYKSGRHNMRFNMMCLDCNCSPQPSIEKTCTAAAAGQLLRELHQISLLASFNLDSTADTIDNAVDCLSDALVGRRRRVGRPLVRTRMHGTSIHR